jgi:hypothetical protein
MTEAEYLNGKDVRSKLIFLESQSSERKARLFTCALGRSLWPYLGDDHSRQVIEVAERFADRTTSVAELLFAEQSGLEARRGLASMIAA